jgi:hypothetical protein
MNIMKTALWTLLVLVVIGGIHAFMSGNTDEELFSEFGIEVFYTPDCGCCVNYAGYLRRQGFEVTATVVGNYEMNRVKGELGIPPEGRSCHTSVIDGFFVEGHMPVQAIYSLLQEQPGIDGIALPDMPSGSPGMPGRVNEPFVVLSVKDGAIAGEYARI